MNTKHLGADVYADETATATATTPAGDIVCALKLDGDRYVVDRVTITRRDDTPPITAQTLRTIAIRSILAGGTADAIHVFDPTTGAQRPATLTDEERETLLSRPVGDELFLWVARLYLVGQLLGEWPAKYVRQSLDVPASTAGAWIRRAKDRGILPGP